MINRKHGLRYSEVSRTTVTLFHAPMLYVGGADDYDNPKFDQLIDFVEKWLGRAKLQFPLCNFEIRTTGIHDSDHRIYAEVVVSSANGSHSEASEWLIEKTESF